MGKFGDKLRRERELRGVTLDEIAEATKIGTRSLRALEEERFDQLPGGIFNKGFVRSYARFLGLDEEQAVADYVAAQSDQPVKADVLEKMAAQAEAARKNEAASVGGEGRRSNRVWVAIAVVILLAIGAGGGWKYYQKYSQQKAAAQSSAEVPPPEVKTAPPGPASLTPTDAAVNTSSGDSSSPSGTKTATTTQSTNAVPVPSTPITTSPAASSATKLADQKPLTSKKALELQIHVVRATWVSVQADGKEPITETLRDSATKTVIAQDRIVLTTGNSVEVTCNGTSLGIFGEDNKRSQMRITADCKVN